MLKEFSSIRPEQFLHFVSTIKQYFPFNLRDKKYYRINAVLARYKFNLGAPTLIVGFEMYVKQHVNLDGFYFQRFFKHKMYSRFGTITYTKYLLVDSFIPANFLNILAVSDRKFNYNSNFFNFFDYFTLNNTELSFKRLLNLDYEFSDGAVDLLFLENRSFLGLRISGFYIDYIISTYYSTCMTIIEPFDKYDPYILNFSPNHIVMNVALDYNYSFFISYYDKTNVYSTDNFFRCLWHLEFLSIYRLFYLNSIYELKYDFSYYLDIVLHIQNYYNLSIVKKIKNTVVLNILSKMLSMFPSIFNKGFNLFNKELLDSLKSFYLRKYIYIYFIFFSIKSQNIKNIRMSSLSWLSIFFDKELKEFFIFNFFSRYKINFVSLGNSLLNKYLNYFSNEKFFYYENFGIEDTNSISLNYSNKIFIRFFNFNFKRKLSRLGRLYFFKVNNRRTKMIGDEFI